METNGKPKKGHDFWCSVFVVLRCQKGDVDLNYCLVNKTFLWSKDKDVGEGISDSNNFSNMPLFSSSIYLGDKKLNGY